MFYEFHEKGLNLKLVGKTIIRMNIGDTNLPVPKCAIDAAIDALKKEKIGYGHRLGNINFRELIARREDCEIENVCIGPGSKFLIFSLLSALKKRIISLPLPAWPPYCLMSRQLNLKIKKINTKQENNWQFCPNDLFPSDISIICNPLNPTSTVYDKNSIFETIKIGKKKKSAIILDEAYKGLSFEDIPNFGIDNVIRVRSFSKEFNMENFRLGYLIADKKIIDIVSKYMNITYTCVPEFVQTAGMAVLKNEKIILNENKKIWKNRIKIASRELRKYEFEFSDPNSGIYIFAAHKKIDKKNFVSKLVRKGILVSSGKDFGGYKKYIRICVNQPEFNLKKAIAIIGSEVLS